MPRGKKFTAEQIIGKLREAEVGLAQGKTAPEVFRKLGVTEQTYYRWRRKCVGRCVSFFGYLVWCFSNDGLVAEKTYAARRNGTLWNGCYPSRVMKLRTSRRHALA